MNEWINESGNSDWAGATASSRKTNETWVESKLFHVIFNEISTKMLQTLPERGERESEGVASWASKKQKLQLKLPSEGQHTHREGENVGRKWAQPGSTVGVARRKVQTEHEVQINNNLRIDGARQAATATRETKTKHKPAKKERKRTKKGEA